MFLPEPRLVDIETIELLLSRETSPDLVEEYYRFGSLMLSEIQNAASQLDSKLTTVMGIASGMLIFLLFGTVARDFALIKTWTNLAAAIALIALATAVYGLMTRAWRLPSEMDWFKEELRDSNLLKKYHVISLLAAHQQHVKLVYTKSNCLRGGEMLIVVSAFVVACILLLAS